METVLFDPGYSSCILGISDSVEFMYDAFINTPMAVKQKKFQFSLILPKIKNLLEKNTAFYLGCLLWAVYIKSKKGAEIENNPYLEEEFDEKKSIQNPQYLLELVNFKLNKDSKYYINKQFPLRGELKPVLDAYIQFLKLNRGFVNTKITDDILLPDSIKIPDKNGIDCIKAKIDEAIIKKDLLILYGVFQFIL